MTPLEKYNALARQRPSLTSVAALKALATTDGAIARLDMGLRGGDFAWRSGNYTAAVTGDPLAAIYIPSDANPTGSAGCWVREEYDGGTVNAGWFGMDTGATENAPAVNGFLDYIRNSKRTVAGRRFCTLSGVMPTGIFSVVASINWSQLEQHTIDAAGCVLYNRATDSTAGTYTICVDAGGSSMAGVTGLGIFADDAKVGLRVSRWDDPSYTPPSGQPAKRKPSAWHKLRDITIAGSFARTALYNGQSEGMTVDGCFIQNSYPAAAASRDPATMTTIITCDGYNEWSDVGAASLYAPLTTPTGQRSGTSNTIAFKRAQLRARAANITPGYLNGVRQFEFAGYSVSGSAEQFVLGDGGLSPGGDDEQNSYDLDFSKYHAEGYGEEDDPVQFLFAMRAVARDVTHPKLVLSDLTQHAAQALIDIEGTKNVHLQDATIAVHEGRVLAAYGTLVTPAKKAQFSGSGTLHIGTTTITRASCVITTTSGSSVVSIAWTANALAAGDLVNLQAATGGALITVNGVTLNGDYTVATAATDSFTIDAGPANVASATGSGDAAAGAVSASLTVARSLDFDSCVSRWDGPIYGGPFARLAKLPKGVQTLYDNAGNVIRKGGTSVVGRSIDTGQPASADHSGTDELPTRARTGQRLPWIGDTTVAPGAVTVAAGATVTVTLSGLTDLLNGSDPVQVIPPPAASSSLNFMAPRVSSATTVTVNVWNPTGSSITIAAGNWVVRLAR